MGYIVFARKWRPALFDDVVGQEHITATLKRAIEKGRVAHAYLFSGTRGVGKTTTARILARALNCEQGPTSEPCGECSRCRAILNGSSLDVLEIDGASNNSVDDVRELRENVTYAAMEGAHRIYVIDEVHMLSRSAFNALLKTLEEPPEKVIFIFATTEPQKVPATIMSRCQRYDFRRISTEQILERLCYICDREEIAYDRGGLRLVARRAEGSMRDGLSLLDQVCSFCGEKVTEEEVRSVLGLVGTDVYSRILTAVADTAPAVVLQAVDEVLYQGFDLAEFLAGLQDHLRNLLFARIPGALDSTRMPLDAGDIARYTEQSRGFSEGDLLRMLRMAQQTEEEIRWSAFPRFAVEMLLLRMVYMDSSVSIASVISMLNHDAPQPEPAGGSRPAPAIPVKKKAPEIPPGLLISSDTDADTTPAPVSSGTGGEIRPVRSMAPAAGDAAPFSEENTSGTMVDFAREWPVFMEKLIHERPNLGSFLSLAYVAASTGSSLDLRFPPAYRFQFSEVMKQNNRADIIRQIHDFAGRPLQVHITLEREKSGGPRAAPDPVDRTRPPSLRDEMEKEEIIGRVLDIFDGEVLE